MYSKACELFRINQNLRAIIDVIEVYRVEGSVVAVKALNVVLNHVGNLSLLMRLYGYRGKWQNLI